MTLEEYQDAAKVYWKDGDYKTLAMGLCEEAGEVTGLLKKHFLYHKELDSLRLEEELGDVMWYVATLAAAYGIPLESIGGRNLSKLGARYASRR